MSITKDSASAADDANNEVRIIIPEGMGFDDRVIDEIVRAIRTALETR